LYTGFVSGIGVAIIAVGYYMYSPLRREISLNRFWGLQNGREITLTSPVSFCHVTEKWCKQATNEQLQTWVVTASFSEQERCLYELRRDMSRPQSDRLRLVIKWGEMETELLLTAMDSEHLWHRRAIVLRKGGKERFYSDDNDDLVMDQIALPSITTER
jgi:hypothetical protein